MPDYDWTSYRNEPAARRFVSGSEGEQAWINLVGQTERLVAARAEAAAYAEALQTFLLITAPLRQRPRPCRVFVSHRSPKPDVDYARRIAWLAHQSGYGYWLDVYDPMLQWLGQNPVPSPAREILIAAAIEMGLLNASHVLAVLTDNSAGSLWIPYEYGRAKEPTPVAWQAGAWVDQTGKTKLENHGEYVRLGVVTFGESDISAWLQKTRGPCLADALSSPPTAAPLP